MVALGMRSFLILELLLVFRLTKHATRSLPGRCPGAAANPCVAIKKDFCLKRLRAIGTLAA